MRRPVKANDGLIKKPSASTRDGRGRRERLEPAVATSAQTLRMWYVDEHAMLFGIRSATIRTKTQSTTQTATVTPFTAQYPANGQKLRPMTMGYRSELHPGAIASHGEG